MASVVKKPSGNYDAIVSMWDKKTKKTKQKRINLLTRDLNDANTRAREVEKNKTYFFDEVLNILLTHFLKHQNHNYHHLNLLLH